MSVHIPETLQQDTEQLHNELALMLVPFLQTLVTSGREDIDLNPDNKIIQEIHAFFRTKGVDFETFQDLTTKSGYDDNAYDQDFVDIFLKSGFLHWGSRFPFMIKEYLQISMDEQIPGIPYITKPFYRGIYNLLRS